jgi:hypothetical protein
MNWLDWSLIFFTLAAGVATAAALVDAHRARAQAEGARASADTAWKRYTENSNALIDRERMIDTLRRELRVYRTPSVRARWNAANELIGQYVCVTRSSGELTIGLLESVSYTSFDSGLLLNLAGADGTKHPIRDAVRVTKAHLHRVQPTPTPPKRCKARLTPGDSPLVLKTVRCELHRGHTEKHRADGVPIDRLAGATTSNWITWITRTNNFHH